MKYVGRKITNPIDKDKLKEKHSSLAYEINHGRDLDGIRYHRLHGNSLHDVFSRAEFIRESACHEERDSIRLRIDCVNALHGEGIIFDIRELSMDKKWAIVRRLKKTDKVDIWGDFFRIDGRGKGSVFYRVLDRVYGKVRFCSMIHRSDGSWNGRGSLLRI